MESQRPVTSFLYSGPLKVRELNVIPLVLMNLRKVSVRNETSSRVDKFTPDLLRLR